MPGIASFLLRAYSWSYCHAWDWRHNVTTCGDIGLYMPTHPKLIRVLFDSLPIESGAFSMVDFGSGKGRVLVSALAYPFARIEGIEIDPRLHGIAEANLRSYSGPRRCQNARSLCMDARAYEIAAAKMVYFFFSPFHGPIMRAVLERIFQSLRDYPRDVFLVYVNPDQNKLIDASGVFVPFNSGKYATVWRSCPCGT